MTRTARIITISVIVAIAVVVLIAYARYGLFSAERFALVAQSSPDVMWSKSVGLSEEVIAASGEYVYIFGTKGTEVKDSYFPEDVYWKTVGYISKLNSKTGWLVYSKRHEYGKNLVDVVSAEIALDSKSDFLYLTMRSAYDDRIMQKTSPGGRILWSKETRAPTKWAVAMRVGPSGNLYIVEAIETHKRNTSKFKIQKMSPSGKLLWYQKINDFGDIDFDNDGNVYVARGVEEPTHTYPAITSYGKKGKPRWTHICADATWVSDIYLAVDKQKDVVNIIIQKPEGQKDIWRKYSTSGKVLSSRQLNIKVDAMVGGSQGKVYFFTKGLNRVTMRGYTRSGKLLFKKAYDNKLFFVKARLSQRITVSTEPDDYGNDAIYVLGDSEPPGISILSRLRVP